MTDFSFLRTALIHGVRVIARPGERIRYCLEDVLKIKAMAERGETPTSAA